MHGDIFGTTFFKCQVISCNFVEKLRDKFHAIELPHSTQLPVGFDQEGL